MAELIDEKPDLSPDGWALLVKVIERHQGGWVYAKITCPHCKGEKRLWVGPPLSQVNCGTCGGLGEVNNRKAISNIQAAKIAEAIQQRFHIAERSER